ncbi:hypothetical protein L209DRAFT_275802 [Thermothelomyces heterothallicus CBS 203.75]
MVPGRLFVGADTTSASFEALVRVLMVDMTTLVGCTIVPLLHFFRSRKRVTTRAETHWLGHGIPRPSHSNFCPPLTHT